jgi:hypothetical protein
MTSTAFVRRLGTFFFKSKMRALSLLMVCAIISLCRSSQHLQNTRLQNSPILRSQSCTIAAVSNLPHLREHFCVYESLNLRGGSWNPVKWFEDAVESAVKEDVKDLLHHDDAEGVPHSHTMCQKRQIYSVHVQLSPSPV